MENFFCSIPAEFYSWEIIMLPEKWQEENILLTEINSLLDYSWIKYTLLKRKLFMIQPNIYIYTRIIK